MGYDPEYAGKLCVYCGWLYEHTNDEICSPMSDSLFDKLSVYLLNNYDKTTPWFKNKVSKEMLHAGTASGIKLSQEEERIALAMNGV